MLIGHAESRLARDVVGVVNWTGQGELKMLSIWHNAIKSIWLVSINVDSTGQKSICLTFSKYDAFLHFRYDKYVKLATKRKARALLQVVLIPSEI